jgi:hypothetical protein
MSEPREVMTPRAVDARMREGRHSDLQLRWHKEAEA